MGGGEEVFTLTPALSLRERGQIEHGLALPPLPWGEGRGEGVTLRPFSRQRKPVMLLIIKNLRHLKRHAVA